MEIFRRSKMPPMAVRLIRGQQEKSYMKFTFQIKKSRGFRHKFDFELGYLVKSPCRECLKRKKFPKCIDDCNDIDKIQTLLSETISCTKDR